MVTFRSAYEGLSSHFVNEAASQLHAGANPQPYAAIGFGGCNVCLNRRLQDVQQAFISFG